jgi:hypothetical protein
MKIVILNKNPMIYLKMVAFEMWHVFNVLM